MYTSWGKDHNKHQIFFLVFKCPFNETKQIKVEGGTTRWKLNETDATLEVFQELNITPSSYNRVLDVPCSLRLNNTWLTAYTVDGNDVIFEKQLIVTLPKPLRCPLYQTLRIEADLEEDLIMTWKMNQTETISCGSSGQNGTELVSDMDDRVLMVQCTPEMNNTILTAYAQTPANRTMKIKELMLNVYDGEDGANEGTGATSSVLKLTPSNSILMILTVYLILT